MAYFAVTMIVGDIKPIVFNGIVSSTGAALSSATYSCVNRKTQSLFTSGSGTIGGPNSNNVQTANITWNTIAQYLMTLTCTFADGVVDHSVNAYINVIALPV
jgi:hypothetical protein